MLKRFLYTKQQLSHHRKRLSGFVRGTGKSLSIVLFLGFSINYHHLHADPLNLDLEDLSSSLKEFIQKNKHRDPATLSQKSIQLQGERMDASRKSDDFLSQDSSAKDTQNQTNGLKKSSDNNNPQIGGEKADAKDKVISPNQGNLDSGLGSDNRANIQAKDPVKKGNSTKKPTPTLTNNKNRALDDNSRKSGNKIEGKKDRNGVQAVEKDTGSIQNNNQGHDQDRDSLDFKNLARDSKEPLNNKDIIKKFDEANSAENAKDKREVELFKNRFLKSLNRKNSVSNKRAQVSHDPVKKTLAIPSNLSSKSMEDNINPSKKREPSQRSQVSSADRLSPLQEDARNIYTVNIEGAIDNPGRNLYFKYLSQHPLISYYKNHKVSKDAIHDQQIIEANAMSGGIRLDSGDKQGKGSTKHYLFFNLSKDKFDLLLRIFLIGSIVVLFFWLRLKKKSMQGQKRYRQRR